MILSDPELCPMVMSRSCIEVHQNHTLLNTAKEIVKRKAGQYKESVVSEEFVLALDLCLRYHIKTVLYLGSYLIPKVVQPPIRFRVKRSKVPHVPPNALQPFHNLGVAGPFWTKRSGM